MKDKPSSATPLAPGSTIGILGSGQLGRMLTLAASNLGLRTHIYSPDGGPNGQPGYSPAGQVAQVETIGAYEDLEAIARFGRSVDAATYEFENVPAATAAELATHTSLFPDARALDVAQDRLTEKNYLSSIGQKTALYAKVDGPEDLMKAVDRIGLPAVIKTRRFGYDGKGQAIIRDRQDISQAWEAMNNAPSILEGFIGFEKEISVIAARSRTGDVIVYTPGENLHRDHILVTTLVPARVADATDKAARKAAKAVITALNYVGVIGIEFFVMSDRSLLINEIAPRVHNSGHWTAAACVISQFEQHMRAVAGWPLIDPGRHSDALMYNLIGDQADQWQSIAAAPSTLFTLYGKHEAREGRKMAHATKLYKRGEVAKLQEIPDSL
jgi:5-(carboxyamino)imidazole ribonucleotide synthase